MSRYQYKGSREMVEDAVREIPLGEPFTLWGLSQSIKARNAPTSREISNILSHGSLATFRNGTWYREDC